MECKNKTYVCFDEEDVSMYRLMETWDGNDNFDFNFDDSYEFNDVWCKNQEETIKERLKEKMKMAKVLVVLIGEKTKFLYKYTEYEVQLAIEANLPIIAVNLNGENKLDKERCPLIIDKTLSLHIVFGEEELIEALEKWPAYHEAYSEKKDSRNYTLQDLI